MKKLILSLVLVSTSLWVGLYAQENETAIPQGLIDKAKNFVTLMTQNDFTAAVADFDSTMTSVMPASKLEETWKTLNAQVGQFKEQTGTRTEQMAQYNIVYVQSSFERAELDIKVVFDDSGKIAGLFFAPSQAQQAPFESATYVNPKLFRKSDITVGSGEWTLPGTLTIPWGKKKMPAVILVHGSGPNDRDETIGPNKPFRDLAEGLSSKGIAVLRYDKRTKIYGSRMAAMLDSLTVKEETIDDALAAVALLRQTPGIDTDRIFVLGHSLGATLIPRIGKEDPKIAGFIVMAGITRPLEDVIVDQFNYVYSLKGDLTAAEKAQLDTLKAQAAFVKSSSLTVDTPPSKLPMNMPARYWLDLRDYKPAEMAKKLPQPMLIMQGLRDYQVTMADFAGWKNALSGRSNVEFKTYPAANHLFIDGEGKITPDEYGHPGHVSEKVINDIADWVNSH
jgi:dienelactone hydrolase